MGEAIYPSGGKEPQQRYAYDVCICMPVIGCNDRAHAAHNARFRHAHNAPNQVANDKESAPQTKVELTATAAEPHSKARGISKPWGAPAPDNGP